MTGSQKTFRNLMVRFTLRIDLEFANNRWMIVEERLR